MKTAKLLRFGTTRKGLRVPLNVAEKTATGLWSYVLNDKGVAVRCFVPVRP